MANPNAAFGLLPIGKVGQNRDAQGLSEYNIAASSSAIYQNDPVTAAATGYITVATSSSQLLGSLNGVFYTNTSTKKPTWANNLAASNTASDIVGFVTDDPYERYEVQASSTLPIADIFLNGNIVYTAGSSANYVSKVTLNTSELAVSTGAQMRVIGVSKGFNNEKLNATTYSTNVVVTAIINNHFYKQFTGI
ncbi:MAG: hypothetical protein EBR30_30140 [Cytophagia bacterium]|jgi:hypothetical protein|nr:hypothetical protein [Cytophagia bacterium]